MADTTTTLPSPTKIIRGQCLRSECGPSGMVISGHAGAGQQILLVSYVSSLSTTKHLTIEDARQLAADLLAMCDAVEQAERKAAADTDATELLDQKKGDPC